MTGVDNTHGHTNNNTNNVCFVICVSACVVVCVSLEISPKTAVDMLRKPKQLIMKRSSLDVTQCLSTGSGPERAGLNQQRGHATRHINRCPFNQLPSVAMETLYQQSTASLCCILFCVVQWVGLNVVQTIHKERVPLTSVTLISVILVSVQPSGLPWNWVHTHMQTHTHTCKHAHTHCCGDPKTFHIAPPGGTVWK